jgi:hypothetical protein
LGEKNEVLGRLDGRGDWGGTGLEDELQPWEARHGWEISQDGIQGEKEEGMGGDSIETELVFVFCYAIVLAE